VNLEHAISISYESAPRSYGEIYAKLASIEKAGANGGSPNVKVRHAAALAPV